jgi:hypothetical protein
MRQTAADRNCVHFQDAAKGKTSNPGQLATGIKSAWNSPYFRQSGPASWQASGCKSSWIMCWQQPRQPGWCLDWDAKGLSGAPGSTWQASTPRLRRSPTAMLWAEACSTQADFVAWPEWPAYALHVPDCFLMRCASVCCVKSAKSQNLRPQNPKPCLPEVIDGLDGQWSSIRDTASAKVEGWGLIAQLGER